MPFRPPFRSCLVGALLLAGCDAAADLAAPAPSARADGVLAIGRVQGDGARSPLEGQAVTVEGVVTGQFSRGLGGFFVQDPGDGDPRTSDALFVIAGKDAPLPRDLAAGDRVRVEGRVVEQEGHPENATPGVSLTALVPAQVRVLGRGEVEPLALAAPPDGPAGWEALEGMRVRIAGPVTIGGTAQLARYGEVAAAVGGRLWQPSERAAPGTPAFAALRAGNARRRIVVDDASNQRNPRRIWYLASATVRAGTVLHGVEAIVDQRHGTYRLQLAAKPALDTAVRPPPPQVPGRLRVAAFNLENLFNGDGRGGGFPTARGARDAAQLRAQTAKLVATIRALSPDIAALMELENDGYGRESSIAQLVDALNAADAGQQSVSSRDAAGKRSGTGRGAGASATTAARSAGTAMRWQFVDAAQGPGNDAIRVGLIYRADKVATQGRPATLQDGPFGRNSRVPLAQTFVPLDGGRRGTPFTVIANHFKSKGCNDAKGENADRGDGAGCWNAVRMESARRLDAWVATDPTGAGGGRTLLVGDFNSYGMEDPLRLLRERGWVDALAGLDDDDRYSYVYDGMAGRLDHALLSPALAARLAGAAIWHCNADEPDEAGYQADDVPGPWRSSDHDPLLLGFDL